MIKLILLLFNLSLDLCYYLYIYSYVNVTVIKLLSNIYFLTPKPPNLLPMTLRESVTVTQKTSIHRCKKFHSDERSQDNDDYYSAYRSLFTGSNEKLISSIIFSWLVHRFYKILGNLWWFSRFTSSGSPRRFFIFYCKPTVDCHCTSIMFQRS